MASPKAGSSSSTAPLSSVQELAKEPFLGAIPSCFLLLDQESSSSFHGDPLSTIPVIDMKQLAMAETDHSQLDKLHSICQDWGIFQLVNHGVGASLIEKLKHEIVEFYKLPVEEKMRYKTRPGDVEGYGQTKVIQEGQKVDWADRFYMIINPLHRRQPHLLPELPSSLRETLESYFLELQKLAMKLFGLLAKALKIEETEMKAIFEDGMQSTRLTYYPPCPQPDMVVGLTPHSDATGITILLQVNGVEGLQIKRDGVWIPVSFLPDAFVVNVGDILEILSNGLYNSIEHRAIVNSTKERISIAVFFNAKFEAELGPSATLVSPENPPLFKRVGMGKYVKDFFSRKMEGKSFLDRMRMSTTADEEQNVT
ncbi:protein SRG1-like [Diospyros lotus]|uniref:protein SRG1-like n=1 Tax=Diospyros lotus TaxID=55363 RepID=UPI002252930E|nr:protein SRG1-like [Diospyros lotus]